MLNSFKSLGLLASLASAAAISDFDLVSRQDTTTTSTCSTGLHLMIAGGCAIPCLADVPSLLSTLIGNLTAAFPGTDQYYVPYNNVSFQGQVSTPVMIAAANQYFVDCPNTPVVFIGYSLGGIIVMNTLCGGLSVTNVPNVLAAVTYGEETYRYPLSYDAGDCTNSAPNYPRNNTQNCLPFAPAIQNICAATDPNCCVGGQDYLSHYTYPQFYDYKMVDFIKAKYAALQASKAATSTTASSTTSTSTSASTVSTVSTVSTTETASASTATVSTTASTTATVAPSTTTVVATTATVAPSTTTVVATTATTTTASTASVSTTVTTISTGSTTTIRSYSNSTFTTTTPSVPGYSVSATTAVSGSGAASGSTSTSTKTVAISITSTIPAAVSTFPAIPNSAVLVPSSVQASYLPTVVTAVSGGATYTAPGTSGASATAAGSSGSGSGSGSSASGTAAGSASGTASGTAIASYTGAADRLSVAGGVVAAGLAAVAMAL